jgi:ABC-type Fe3+ transport system substrate-binding protein
LDLDPTAKIRIALPEDEVFPTAYFHTAILKRAKYPNAALLLAGWFASPEGQKQFDKIIHRGYALQEGTEINRILKKQGAKVYYRGWEWKPEDENRQSKEIVEAWGFPVPKK